MKRTPPKSLAAAVAAVVVASLLSASAQATAAPSGPDRKVIVMLAGEQGDAFLDKATKANVRASKKRKLASKLVNAVAMTVPASDVAKLAALAGVAGVYPDLPVRAQTETSVGHIGAPNLWDPAGGGAKGEGMTIAVIDTGVDYSHPDLGGGLGAGFKVIGGYDFVNGDADPMDDNGHGTHVAGIVAGKAAASGGITGVAPEANLLAYKVMNEWGEGLTSDVVAGIDAAADPANPNRADVINLSLGNSGDGNDPVAQAAAAASRSGVVVVASAGNSGPGEGTVGSPAVAEGVIAVGASTSGLRLPVAHLASPNQGLLQTYRGALSANPPTAAVTAQLVDVGWGTPEEWASAGDVTGKIVRVNTFIGSVPQDVFQSELDLAREAENRGALAIIGGQDYGMGPWSVQPGVAQVAASNRILASGDTFRMDRLVVMGMDNTQYQELTRLLAAGRVDIKLSGDDRTDEIASFSSRGPDRSFGLKPDLVAPGVDIRSAVPKALYAPGEYRMSGTSMAAPHVAGAAALLRQLNPQRTPAQVKAALMGTSKQLSGTAATDHGAGRIDLVAAAKAVVLADPPSLSLGLADLSKSTVGGTKTVTLHNTSSTARTVKVTGDDNATVSPSSVVIGPGASASVEVTVKAARPDGNAEVSGTVTATPDNGPAVHVPYLLVVKPLMVQTSPDPADGPSTVYVYSPAELSAPPVISVEPPKGPKKTVTATQVNPSWYSANVEGKHEGTYRVAVTARATTGQVLNGTSSFEVLPEKDRKKRWEPVGPYNMGGQLSLSPSNPQQGIMTQDGHKAGVWLTTNKGTSWTELNRVPVFAPARPPVVIVDDQKDGTWWYGATDVGDGKTKLLRTTNKGGDWKVLAEISGYLVTMVADATRQTLVAVTDNDLFISTDAGETWAQQSNGTGDYVTHAAIANGNLYLNTSRGIWVREGITGETRQIYSANYLYSIVANETVIAAWVPRVGIVGSYDKGQTWSTLYSMPSFWGTQLSMSGNDIFLATSLRKGIVSHDNGRTWADMAVAVPDAAQLDYDRWADGTVTHSLTSGLYNGTQRIGVQGQTVYDLAFSGNTLMAGTDVGLYKTQAPAASPDWGNSGDEGWIGVTPRFVVTSPHDQNVVWRVVKSAFGSFSVQRSGDGGQTWEEKGNSTEVPTALSVHPADPSKVYVSFARLGGAGLYATTDGGTTWKNLYHGMPFEAVAGDPANANRLWLSNSSGLYRSDDGGVTLTKVFDGAFATIYFDGERLIAAGRSVIVSTNGGRTWRQGDTGALSTLVTDVVKANGVFYASTASHWPNGFIKGGRGVLRSDDGGLTWRNISSGLSNLDVQTLAVSPDGKFLFAGTALGGVHRIAI